MTPGTVPRDALQRVLDEDLTRPLHLTRAEATGGWRDLFPDLASSLPLPYPIYGRDEDRVVALGYPVVISPAIRQLRHELERQQELEVEYRVVLARGGRGDKAKVMAQRERYLRAMTSLFENVLLNDYGRRLPEVLLLFHSCDLAAVAQRAGVVARRLDPDVERRLGDVLRHELAAVFADLLQRAALAATERLRGLARAPLQLTPSPLLAVLCRDGMLLTETAIPTDLSQLRGYLRSRLHQDVNLLSGACQRAADILTELPLRRPDLLTALELSAGVDLKPLNPRVFLQPRLLDALVATGLTRQLGFDDDRLRLLREVGLRLKRHELLATLRRRVLVVEAQEGGPVLGGRSPVVEVAPSTRPFDFGTPGVVESSVRRFGLVYDLSNFTAQLEEVRKKGRAAEEKALQFMFVFQNQLEEIRRRRRLTFEKFLGDGAFYSARRAVRVVAAACEIQAVYDQLRRSGFPFDQGLRIAMNYGTFRLLPMMSESGEQRFEFFGHGIVELVRLTTGKSTREMEQIAEFLVHSGFDPGAVDAFLAPLAGARGGRDGDSDRPYRASIDPRGELVNEGIVASLPFVEALEREILGKTPRLLEEGGTRWAAFPGEAGGWATSAVPGFALRYLGVVRLKGLQPLELAEIRPCEPLTPDATELSMRHGLVALLRGLATEGGDGERERAVPEDLVVATYLEPGGERRWLFGEYRAGDDIVLHAIEVALRPPELAPGESLETWLFRNRSELLRLYEGLRREVGGVSQPLAGLRQHEGYQACFLAAPHRSPA